MKKLDKEILNVLRPNVVKNDLLYIASVLSYIDEVLTQTYGPYSGYVASIKGASDPSLRELTYTKDGFRTLLNMSFNTTIEIDILKMVRKLADKIKSASGDGSTTGAKVLYGMIKNAAEYILNNDKSNDIRIHAPKATEIILKLLNKAIQRNTKKVTSSKDILDCAFIALNNDESLMKPFYEIAEDIEKNNVDLSNGIEIAAFKSLGSKTTVDKNPGFNLGAYHFVGRPIDYTLKNTKVILFTNNFSMDYNNFILKTLLSDAQVIGEQSGIHTLYMVAGLDNTSKRELAKVMKSYEEANKVLYANFVEVPYIYDASNYKREDLTYFLKVDEININDFVEKRDKIVDPAVDTRDNDLICKWRVAVDEDGKLVDNLKGYREYQDAIMAQIQKGVLCNVKYTHGMGLTITPSDDIKQENTAYKKHIDKLKEIVETSKEEDLIRVAKERLLYMKEHYYTIYVERRVSDEDRLFDAYNDASRAITAMIKDGYCMGASVGSLYILDDIEKEINNKLSEYENPIHSKSNNLAIYKSAREIVKMMIDSFTDIIPLLYPQEEDLREAFKKGIIDSDNMTVNGVRVIAPINTDRAIISIVLLQFSHLFSSLMIELDHPDDVFVINTATEDINKKLNGDNTPRYTYSTIKKEEPITIDEITPAYGIDKEIKIGESANKIKVDTNKSEEPNKYVYSTIKKEESISTNEIKPADTIDKEKNPNDTVNKATVDTIKLNKEEDTNNNRPRFSVASDTSTTTNNEEFEKMKAMIDEKAKNNLAANSQMGKAITEAFEKDSGTKVEDSVEKFKKSMEEYYTTTNKEVVKDDKTGVAVEIEYPKGITPDDLEKIKNGEFGEL